MLVGQEPGHTLAMRSSCCSGDRLKRAPDLRFFVPAAACRIRPPTRLAKNSSRLLEVIARNCSRSYNGVDSCKVAGMLYKSKGRMQGSSYCHDFTEYISAITPFKAVAHRRSQAENPPVECKPRNLHIKNLHEAQTSGQPCKSKH